MGKNKDIDEENYVGVSPNRVTVSGARSLAHLLLLEQDFRRCETAEALGQLLVNRLDGFTEYDCVLFWFFDKRGQIGMTSISGMKHESDGKLLRKWSMKVAKWLSKNTMNMVEINSVMIPGKIFDYWPEVFPMEGLYIPIQKPIGKSIGGIFILREHAWSKPIKIMLQQMSEMVGYSLYALELGIYKKSSKTFGKSVMITFIGLFILFGFIYYIFWKNKELIMSI